MSNFKEEVFEYLKETVKLLGVIFIISFTFWVSYKLVDLMIKADKYEDLVNKSEKLKDSIPLKEGYKMEFVYPEEIGLIELGDKLFVEDIVINNSTKTVVVVFGYLNS